MTKARSGAMNRSWFVVLVHLYGWMECCLKLSTTNPIMYLHLLDACCKLPRTIQFFPAGKKQTGTDGMMSWVEDERGMMVM
ncbi:hypothetical protein Naga_100018g12 [Nannochloropsis gaditana]|uniref:Secreted protein n=1 Tax=Nannochloropsis gaditana TaxID=72520 RepID=W7U291_9STRA|nr:hypothetical protein Naga_100018g12 [Nannochloropsis gaditana]